MWEKQRQLAIVCLAGEEADRWGSTTGEDQATLSGDDQLIRLELGTNNVET